MLSYKGIIEDIFGGRDSIFIVMAIDPWRLAISRLTIHHSTFTACHSPHSRCTAHHSRFRYQLYARFSEIYFALLVQRTGGHFKHFLAHPKKIINILGTAFVMVG